MTSAKKSAKHRRMSKSVGVSRELDCGAIVDDTFPIEKVEAALRQHNANIDFGAFREFFSLSIAIYRHREDPQNFPDIKGEIAYVQKLCEDLGSVATRIVNLPIHTDADFNMQCRALDRRSDDLGSPVERLTGIGINLEHLCLQARNLLFNTLQKLEHVPGPPRGRRVGTNRDALLDSVVNHLVECGMSRNSARPCAAAVLMACGIQTSEDGRTRPQRRKGG